LEVLEAFGPEAPNNLNTYACQIEDAFVQALQHQHDQAQALATQHQYIEHVHGVLAAANQDREAMVKILSEPAILADYTQKFFGPDGPMPIQTEGEQARAALAAGMVTPDGPLLSGGVLMETPLEREMAARAQQAAAQLAPQGAPSGYQRPRMPMPQPGTGAGFSAADAGSFWAQFSQLMETRPEMGHLMLANAHPEALRSKVLIAEG